MFTEALPETVLSLIDRMASRPAEMGFYLAGGTALALHLGHRRSVDLDYFTEKPFDTERVAQMIASFGGEIRVREADTVHAMIDGVKCSFFSYPYRLLGALTDFRGLLLASIPDIAAMKVVAIAQRGTKKDFFDMYRILRDVPPRRLKEWFLGKFGANRVNCYHVLRSFLFFDEAESEPDPLALDETRWQDVKAFFLSQEKQLFADLLPPPARGT
ncbi:MAG TPA: nucleotidyl transferase AbiEii/AbiGii toxin family protein [Candidatus Ozemobacteraceae bacterium]|nr:nucleotidyl transferase AbiEii/AbiGii toxin family protein [Candidatus Ozemobacteraceae bacterium]